MPWKPANCKMAKYCTFDPKPLFLDEAFYRNEKKLGIDLYREDPVEVVMSYVAGVVFLSSPGADKN